MVLLGRVKKDKASIVVSVPKQIQDALGWKGGDRVAFRMAGEKLIAERVPLEQFAKLRTGEAEAHT